MFQKAVKQISATTRAAASRDPASREPAAPAPAARARAHRHAAIVGTPAYMAPELLKNDFYYTEKVDVYALALALWGVWVSSSDARAAADDRADESGETPPPDEARLGQRGRSHSQYSRSMAFRARPAAGRPRGAARRRARRARRRRRGATPRHARRGRGERGRPTRAPPSMEPWSELESTRKIEQAVLRGERPAWPARGAPNAPPGALAALVGRAWDEEPARRPCMRELTRRARELSSARCAARARTAPTSTERTTAASSRASRRRRPSAGSRAVSRTGVAVAASAEQQRAGIADFAPAVGGRATGLPPEPALGSPH